MEKKRPGATTGKASASKETTPSSTEEETSEESRDNSSRTSGREEEKEHRSSSSSSPTGPLVQLMTRTGYNIYQQNGQRRYGPPPDWTGSPPRGCEVFVGKIPRDCLEDELVPVFEKAGPVYEMRLMMECNDLNRGYAFVVYCKATDAKKSVKMLNNYEIRKVGHCSGCAHTWPARKHLNKFLFTCDSFYNGTNGLHPHNSEVKLIILKQLYSCMHKSMTS